MDANGEPGRDAPRCSFCGKDAKEVVHLIAGPAVYICNECLELCMGVYAERHWDRFTRAVADTFAERNADEDESSILERDAAHWADAVAKAREPFLAALNAIADKARDRVEIS